MTIILIMFLLLCFYKVKISGFNQNYLSHEATMQINGVFVFLVLLSHFTGYIVDHELLAYSAFYLRIREMLGQLVVTTFLFYSGYGVMESIKKKGSEYVDGIPTKIIVLTINFSVAIFAYYIVGINFGKNISASKLLLSCIGWESIGNSNWYLFDILALYAISYFAFKLGNGNKKVCLFYIFIFSLGIMNFVYQYRVGTRWYNTLLCYWAGMIYSFNKNKLDKIVMKNACTYMIYGLSLILLFIICYNKRDIMLYYILHGILFSLIITWGSMILKMDNPILMWIGGNIFGIYILQRIPMMIGSKIPFIYNNYLLYLLLSVIITFIMAEIFKYCTKQITKRMIETKNG